MSEPNIYTAINAVMAEVGYVKKQRSPNLNYTYAGEAALIKALRPEMVEQGIVVFMEGVDDVVTREYTTAKGAVMTNVTLTARFRLVHAASGTFIEVASRGEGSDSGDKANNKAATCAYKYMLRQTFMIETGDDPDNFQPASRQQDTPAPVSKPANGNGKPAEQPAPVTITVEAAKDTVILAGSKAGKKLHEVPPADVDRMVTWYTNNAKTDDDHAFLAACKVLQDHYKAQQPA